MPTISYESFVSEWLIHDAIIRNLEIIGEATNHVSEKLKEEFPDVTWKDAVGMRNFLIHEYFGIDFQAVWSTLTNDLPFFKNDINKIINEKFEPSV